MNPINYAIVGGLTVLISGFVIAVFGWIATGWICEWFRKHSSHKFWHSDGE